MKSAVKLLSSLLVLSLPLIGCSDSSPSEPAPPESVPLDSMAIINPPPAGQDLDGGWKARDWGYNTQFSINTEWCWITPTNTGVQQYAADVRVDGNRVWFEVQMPPLAGFCITYNGTRYGNTIVGWYRLWYFLEKERITYKYKPQTFVKSY